MVALADADEAALAAAASAFPVPRTTTDYRELLDDPGHRRGGRGEICLWGATSAD